MLSSYKIDGIRKMDILHRFPACTLKLDMLKDQSICSMLNGQLPIILSETESLIHQGLMNVSNSLPNSMMTSEELLITSHRDPVLLTN